MFPSPVQYRSKYGCRFCKVVHGGKDSLNQHLDCHAFELQTPHGPRPVQSTNGMHPASIIRAVRAQTPRRLERPGAEDAVYQVECGAWSLIVTLNSAQDVIRHRTLDRTGLDAEWWIAFAKAGFAPGSRSDPRTTRGWREWQRNNDLQRRQQEQQAADELRRQRQEQARADAEERRLELQAEAAANELAAQAVIDAEIAEALRLAEELFRAEAAEAAEALLAAHRLAEEAAAQFQQHLERQRLADEVEFEANTASWAVEQLVLSQLDNDRVESASVIELATQQTALEEQAEEQTLLLHAAHKGKGPSVAGPVSNNSWAIRNRGRGISGIVAANGPVSVCYGVGVSTDISAPLPAESAATTRKRPAPCDPEQDHDRTPGSTIWVRLRDTNHVLLVPAHETLATTIARFMEDVDPYVATACAGIMGAGKPPAWIAMTRAHWAGKWDDEVWAVVKSWGGRQRGTVEVEVEAVWCWE